MQWNDRELVLLRAVLEFEREGSMPSFSELVQRTGLPERQAEMGFRALMDANMLTGLNATAMDRFEYLDIRLLPDGRRVLGQWPSL